MLFSRGYLPFITFIVPCRKFCATGCTVFEVGDQGIDRIIGK